jgi:hypothetical protein
MNDIVFKRIKIRTQDDDNSDEWCLASLSLEVVSKPQIRFPA